MALNMRNSAMSVPAMNYLSQCIETPSFYITALSFKFCYLNFEDIMQLASGIKFNKTIIKLDLSSNGMKACVAKFLLESLLDNFCLADISFAGNFLDNEFACDLAHLLEGN